MERQSQRITLTLALMAGWLQAQQPRAQSPANQSSPGVESLLDRLEDVKGAAGYKYNLKDDQARSMDCLDVIQRTSSTVFGIYHTLESGHFRVRLARSSNLLQWTWVCTIDSDASQATLRRLKNGAFLCAYEHSVQSRIGIRLRYYKTETAMIAGKVARQFDIPRSLAPTAEGTPSFDRIDLDPDLDHSRIKIRFHYYDKQDSDKQAWGELQDFSTWTAKPDEALNRRLHYHGFRGNYGDRSPIRLRERDFSLIEAQFRKNDWRSWRSLLLVHPTNRLLLLRPRTHKGSRAFCNPSWSLVSLAGRKRYLVVNFFVPSEGAAPGEAGQLLFFHEWQL